MEAAFARAKNKACNRVDFRKHHARISVQRFSTRSEPTSAVNEVIRANRLSAPGLSASMIQVTRRLEHTSEKMLLLKSTFHNVPPRSPSVITLHPLRSKEEALQRRMA